MRVLERRVIQLQQSDLVKQAKLAHKRGLPKPDDEGRAKGIHLSQVLKYVAVTTGMLKPGDEDLEENFPLRMALGMAWEGWIQALWPDMEWQPGELFKDGVYGNPDGFSELIIPRNGVFINAPEQLVEEIKLTWKSSRNRHDNITAEWLWMRQIMGYCTMLDEEVDLGRLHVLWVNGDYKHPYEQAYVTYLVKYEKAELRRNWEMVQRNKDKVVIEEGH